MDFGLSWWTLKSYCVAERIYGQSLGDTTLVRLCGSHEHETFFRGGNPQGPHSRSECRKIKTRCSNYSLKRTHWQAWAKHLKPRPKGRLGVKTKMPPRNQRLALLKELTTAESELLSRLNDLMPFNECEWKAIRAIVWFGSNVFLRGRHLQARVAGCVCSSTKLLWKSISNELL